MTKKARNRVQCPLGAAKKRREDDAPPGSVFFIRVNAVLFPVLFFIALFGVQADAAGETSLPRNTLSVDMVDSNFSPITSPVVYFPGKSFSFNSQTSTVVLGSSLQKIKIVNTMPQSEWTLSIAATEGINALWRSGNSYYDYNDNSGQVDGPDSDSFGGSLYINPNDATITPLDGGSSVDGIIKGNPALFRDPSPSVSSITLLSASSSAPKKCAWSVVGISLRQTIPAAQRSGTYNISFTLTIA